MEVKREVGGKRSRQQLERETDEVIQQIVAKAKAAPVVQKRSIQINKKLEPDVFRLKPSFIKRERTRIDNNTCYRRPIKILPKEDFEAQTAAPPTSVVVKEESNELGDIVLDEDDNSSLERPTTNSFFWQHRSFPHL